MVSSVALAALKFFAILTAGLLGAIGLLVDFKKDGKVTKWGRRALIGTVISTVVAVFIQSIETYQQNFESRRQNKSRLEQEERNEATLREIRRGLYVIKDAEFSVTIRIPKPPDEVKAYLKRINSYVLRHRQDAEDEQDERYLLLEEKKLYPQLVSERVAYTALMRPDLVLRIFKDQRKSDCFWKARLAEDLLLSQVVVTQDHKLPRVLPNYRLYTSCEADLELKIDPPATSNLSISVGVTKGQVLVRLRSLHATVTELRGNADRINPRPSRGKRFLRTSLW